MSETLGVVLTLVMSVVETALGATHAYFDGAIMLLFFLPPGIGRRRQGDERLDPVEEVAVLRRHVGDAAGPDISPSRSEWC
jgi:hypothetical protein